MWHGQTCYITQIKTKRVGAWPLWIFSMVAQIFNVFKFIFAKSSRRKIFFCWGHTNTLGTFLRRSPQVEDGLSQISNFDKSWWLDCRCSYSTWTEGADIWKLLNACFLLKTFLGVVMPARLSSLYLFSPRSWYCITSQRIGAPLVGGLHQCWPNSTR